MRASLTCVWAVVVVAGLSVSLTGCGGGDSSSGTPPITGGGEAKPLEGKKVSDADQLLGGWVTASAAEDQFAGMEFLPEGKVLMSFDGGHAEQATYSVLEGGRLSMKDPHSSQVIIWNVTIAGDQMELTAETAGANGVEKTSKRLRRLKKDESLAAAMSALKEERKKFAQARRDAVYALIKNTDLVIVAKGAGSELPAAVAIGPEDPKGQRTAIHDDKPPHRDGFTIYPGSATQTGAMTINVAYLAQVEPPPVGQQQPGGSFVFEFTGDPASPKVIAKVQYGGQPLELEMKRDAKLHGEVTGRFKEELAKVESLKKPLIDALKDIAVLEGPSASFLPGSPDNTARFTLVRDAEKGIYTGEGTLSQVAAGGRVNVSPYPQPTASILIADGKPMLLIDAQLVQYQLTLDESGKKLTGGWFNTGNPNGFVAELEIKSAMDTATHKAKVDAERKVLGSLSAGSPLVGLSPGARGGDAVAHPVSLALTSDASGNAAGTAVFPIVKLTVAAQAQIVDTLAGPRLVVKFANPIEVGSQHAQGHANAIRHQAWTYAVAGGADGSGPLVLTDGSDTLTQLTESAKAALTKKFADALTAGLTMQMLAPINHDKGPQIVMTYKLEPDGKTVKGTYVSGAMINGFEANSSFTGQLGEVGGLPMIVGEMANPEVPKRFRYIFGTELIFFPAGEGFGYSACHWATHVVNGPRGYTQWQQAAK